MKYIIQITALSFALAIAGCATQKSQQPSPVTTAKPDVYTIQPGDTLMTIAQEHDLTMKQLKDLNPGIVPAHLRAGQTVYLAAHAKSGANTYVVQTGDTLLKIAKEHDLTIQQLKDLNPEMPKRLTVGETLYVVAPANK